MVDRPSVTWFGFGELRFSRFLTSKWSLSLSIFFMETLSLSTSSTDFPLQSKFCFDGAYRSYFNKLSQNAWKRNENKNYHIYIYYESNYLDLIFKYHLHYNLKSNPQETRYVLIIDYNNSDIIIESMINYISISCWHYCNKN